MGVEASQPVGDFPTSATATMGNQAERMGGCLNQIYVNQDIEQLPFCISRVASQEPMGAASSAAAGVVWRLEHPRLQGSYKLQQHLL